MTDALNTRFRRLTAVAGPPGAVLEHGRWPDAGSPTARLVRRHDRTRVLVSPGFGALPAAEQDRQLAACLARWPTAGGRWARVATASTVTALVVVPGLAWLLATAGMLGLVRDAPWAFLLAASEGLGFLTLAGQRRRSRRAAERRAAEILRRADARASAGIAPPLH